MHINRELFALLFTLGMVLGDFYLYRRIVKPRTQNLPFQLSKVLRATYWLLSAGCWLAFISLLLLPLETYRTLNAVLTGSLTINATSKIIPLIIQGIGDLRHLMLRSKRRRQMEARPAPLPGKPQTRRTFLTQLSLGVSAVTASTFTWGIISGAHDYRIRRVTLRLPNLPAAFHGIRLAQISDIHSGSFYNRTAVAGGVDMLLAEKPDIVCFTGDIVNEETAEMNSFVSTFSKVQAPLGTFAILGNHDYGDYRTWPSPQAKTQNMEDLYALHRAMGWQLLTNQNKIITQGGEQLAIIGVENWGKGRFPKLADLPAATKGTGEAPVKILLSHDPSHWDAHVRPEYPNIDLTLSGHTHGFQFGIEAEWLRWSPSQYLYPQWAGLYTQGQQHLYVNRGFGFLGYPGRIGMPPEITLFTLEKA